MTGKAPPPPPSPPIGSSYPAAQLARALMHAESEGDGAHGGERVRRWTDALLATLSGSVATGSRQPVASLPVWVTLEVVTGGFTTGKALSAGPLRPHEERLLAELGAANAPQPRLALNRYFLSDAGLRRLVDALQEGRFEIEVPEEGALPTVAWLLARGHVDHARGLIDALAPHMAELRFYPALTDAPHSTGSLVHLETAGTTARRLKAKSQNPRVLAQREAVSVWTPIYDRLVALFLETVDGAPPQAQRDSNGAWRRGPGHAFIIEGGWPCARRPQGWEDRATALMAELQTARKQHRRCGRATRRGETLTLLGDALARMLADPAQLSGREVGRIRLVLARYVAARGLPGSETAQQQRAAQWEHATAPTHQEIAAHIALRLERLSPSEGVDDLGLLAADIPPGEVNNGALARGARVPPSLIRTLERCVRDSVEGLVKRGLIPSSEVLAQVLPQLTSGLRAAGIADRALRGLYAAVYRAFRRRRSLLLLDLQKQIQITELPWMAAIERHRCQDLPAAELAKQALVETSVLALTAFPQAMLPNKLIEELGSLAQAAQLSMPLTEELAADIFMGRFSPKFGDAAMAAATFLRDSPYARHYGIDCDAVARALAPQPTAALRRTHPNPGDALAQVCARRAGVALGTRRPATNGQVIEQQLILTTHNLAALATLPGVREVLAARAVELSQRCFDWVLQHLQLPEASHHVGLIRIKNAAYAWRQMMFFLSLGEREALPAFVSWTHERLAEQPAQWRARFKPAWLALAHAAGVPEAAGAGTPLLGWTSERHWLMPPPRGKGAPVSG